MPCCLIPNAIRRSFPGTLQPDANRFAKYVSSVTLASIPNAPITTILANALHFEMKLWSPTFFSSQLYKPNESFSNAWSAMLAAWRNRKNGDRFTEQEKANILVRLGSLPASIKGVVCACELFDEWILDLMLDLRMMGIDPKRKPQLQRPFSALANFGLSQKLINIFVKYEMCWQSAGQMIGGAFVGYGLRQIPELPNSLCALHAPIDRIFLESIIDLPLGRHLMRARLLRKSDVRLHQSLDGNFRPWSQLDCLRTYYGLQLMLRRIAMSTWPAGCACGLAPNGNPIAAAKALIINCAATFERRFGAANPCGNGQTDWIQAAVDLPDSVIDETLCKMRGFLPGGDNLASSNQTPAPKPTATDRPKATDGATHSNLNPEIWLNELSSKTGQIHNSALRVVADCKTTFNLGAICKCHGHAWLDVQPGLLALSPAFNTDFRRIATACVSGKSHCWGGSAYVMGKRFNSSTEAIQYLNRFFTVRRCPV